LREGGGDAQACEFTRPRRSKAATDAQTASETEKAGPRTSPPEVPALSSLAMLLADKASTLPISWAR